jgi:hypothetical protein
MALRLQKMFAGKSNVARLLPEYDWPGPKFRSKPANKQWKTILDGMALNALAPPGVPWGTPAEFFTIRPFHIMRILGKTLAKFFFLLVGDGAHTGWHVVRVRIFAGELAWLVYASPTKRMTLRRSALNGFPDRRDVRVPL